MSSNEGMEVAEEAVVSASLALPSTSQVIGRVPFGLIVASSGVAGTDGTALSFVATRTAQLRISISIPGTGRENCLRYSSSKAAVRGAMSSAVSARSGRVISISCPCPL